MPLTRRRFAEYSGQAVLSRVGACGGIVKSEMVLLASHKCQQP